MNRLKSYAESPAGLQVGHLADKYNIPPHEVAQWPWRKREFNSTVANSRDAYEAEKKHEHQKEQRRKRKQRKNKGEPELDPPEHGFDFSDIDGGEQEYAETESGRKIPAALAKHDNVAIVRDDEDEDEPDNTD